MSSSKRLLGILTADRDMQTLTQELKEKLLLEWEGQPHAAACMTDLQSRCMPSQLVRGWNSEPEHVPSYF